MKYSDIRVIFGLKVKQVRQDLKLSLKQFSNHVGLSPSYLNEIEKGKKYPKSEKIMQIAEALGISYDELVSQKLDDSMNFLEELLQSSFIKKIPFELFGISVRDVVGLLPQTPKEGQALINALMETTRSYDMRVEDFFHTTLRCFQKMHQNYFPDIESAVVAFREKHTLNTDQPLSYESLCQILKETYKTQIDVRSLGEQHIFSDIRSIHIPGKQSKCLINPRLSTQQKNFAVARELGFRALNIKHRSHCSPDLDVQSFEQVLSAFQASYFASALILPKENLTADLKTFFSTPHWDSEAFMHLIDKYGATSEMFFYRLSELCPHALGLSKLHFLRLHHNPQDKSFVLSKHLNMSQVSIPTGLDLNEHFCKKWLSASIIDDYINYGGDSKNRRIDIQRSSFYGREEEEFICFCIARPLLTNPKIITSITIGFQLNEVSKSVIKFWDDPKINQVSLGETCERCECPPEACKERAAPNIRHQQNQATAQKRSAISKLINKN